jgi:electron transfer flavoprotein beta subunit
VKIGVLLKQVPDTESRIKPAADGKGVDPADIKWIVNPYDEFAIEQALLVKGTTATEVVVVSLGPARTVDAARTALAMGADRAVILDEDAFQGSDAFGVARALAAVIEKEGIDLVFAGKQAIDDDNVQVPQMVAALLGWPHAAGIVGFAQDGDAAKVKRGVGGGSVEHVKVRLPAVFTCDKGLNTPRFASLPGIMKAKTKPVKKYSAADLGVDGDVGAGNARVTFSGYHAPPPRPPGRLLPGEMPDQVKELVRLLRQEAKVL